MKKRLLFLAIMIIAVMSVLAITVSAENNIIKLSTLPTLEQIHANPSAYVSHLDEFDKDDYKTYREKDSTSVIVFSDLAETPTYYVYPAYYFIRSGSWNGGSYVGKLNEAIAAADSTAFANYSVFGRGGSLYYIRVEMPTYVTTLSGWNKFEGSTNVKEIYFPTHIVEDSATGKLKEVAYLTTISDANIFSSCSKLEVIHNIEFLPAGINNGGGFAGCSSLKYVKLPEGITSIATEMFSGCTSLESVDIPYGVTSIGSKAFENCDSIKKITLPNSVVSFAKKSFAYMDNLEEINFGAGLTNIYATDHNCENLDGCSKLKYVYLPATFATTVQNTGHNILATGTNVTLFFTGNLQQAEALRTKLTTSANNDLIKNAVFMDYTAPENANIDFDTYAQTQGKTILVYNYNECEAFYNNDHNYQNETNNCLDGVTCTRCDDNVTSFTQHNMKETLVYANGFVAVGVYNKYCANATNCTHEKVVDAEAPVIFKMTELHSVASVLTLRLLTSITE